MAGWQPGSYDACYLAPLANALADAAAAIGEKLLGAPAMSAAVITAAAPATGTAAADAVTAGVTAAASTPAAPPIVASGCKSRLPLMLLMMIVQMNEMPATAAKIPAKCYAIYITSAALGKM